MTVDDIKVGQEWEPINEYLLKNYPLERWVVARIDRPGGVVWWECHMCTGFGSLLGGEWRLKPSHPLMEGECL